MIALRHGFASSRTLRSTTFAFALPNKRSVLGVTSGVIGNPPPSGALSSSVRYVPHHDRYRYYISLPSSLSEMVADVWETIKGKSNEKRRRLVVHWKRSHKAYIENKARVSAIRREKRDIMIAKIKVTKADFRKRLQERAQLASSRAKSLSEYSSNLRMKFKTAVLAKTNKLKSDDNILELDIDEAEKEWFDKDGFPVTSRDSRTGRFLNPWSITSSTPPFLKFLKWRKERLFDMESTAMFREPKTEIERETFLPMINYKSNDRNIFDISTTSINSPVHLQWIGHSTCLVRMKSSVDQNKNEEMYNVLTDPVFSHHASPIKTGIPRMVPPALTIDELRKNLEHCGKLDAVVLSHDHYDHLDVDSLAEIERKCLLNSNGKYFVPLGHKQYLMEHCDIPSDKIIELEWWESDASLSKNGTSLKITCAPAQHWCSRTPFDRNLRLWGSWALRVENQSSQGATSISSFYFAGDTGVPEKFPLHEQIGDRLGPFDLSALPIGAYKPSWFMKESHCSPEEAVRMHKALRTRYSVSIHWGTWALADEPYFEPPLQLRDALEKENLNIDRDFFVLRHGDCVSIPENEMNESLLSVPSHPIFQM